MYGGRASALLVLLPNCLPSYLIEFCRMAHHFPVSSQREQPAPCWPRPLSTQASKTISRAANPACHEIDLFLLAAPAAPTIGGDSILMHSKLVKQITAKFI
jgi:hypothetical protein